MSFLPRTAPADAATFEEDWFPEAVVFDCDGVLMDTESSWGRVVASVSHELGLDEPQRMADKMTALTASQIAEALAAEAAGPQASASDVEQHAARILHRLSELDARRLEDGVDLIDGVEDLLRRLSEVLPVAVASNSSGSILDTKLEHGELTGYLRTWVSCDDVAEGKPAPDMYLEAVRRLGARPERTLTFEDSTPGATAALAAGTRTVVLGEDSQAPAHFVVSDFRDPDFLARIEDWLEAARTARVQAAQV